jgi:hypothetical protein
MENDRSPSGAERRAMYGRKVRVYGRGIWPKACAVSLVASAVIGGMVSDHLQSRPIKLTVAFSGMVLACGFWLIFLLSVRFELRERGLFYRRGARRFGCLYTEIESSSGYSESYETTIAISLADGTAQILDGIGSGGQAFKKLREAIADGRLESTLWSRMQI